MGFASSVDVRVSVMVPQAELYFCWACCTPAQIRFIRSVGCSALAGNTKIASSAAVFRAVLISGLEKAVGERPDADSHGIANRLHLGPGLAIFVHRGHRRL